MTYTLRLYGKVVPDETRTYRVNSSTDCWIRELSDVTTGSIVTKNQILAEALSPAYYNAQVTYLISLDNIDRIKQQLGGQLRHQQGDLANNQIRVAVQALQNLGITDAQTEEFANTRQARPYLQVRVAGRRRRPEQKGHPQPVVQGRGRVLHHRRHRKGLGLCGCLRGRGHAYEARDDRGGKACPDGKDLQRKRGRGTPPLRSRVQNAQGAA